MPKGKEIVGVHGERVERDKWLERPVYSYMPWSPLGAHIEALAYIFKGQPVLEDVLQVDEADFLIDTSGLTFFEMINSWNGKKSSQREQLWEHYFLPMVSDIAGNFANDPELNVKLNLINPNVSAQDMKNELVRMAVTVRLNQPESGFQDA